MTRIPPYESKEVIRKVIKAGYVLKRHGKGSHDIYYNSEIKRYVTIPNHQGQSIPIGTIRAIIRAMGLSNEEFIAL
ncbi:type II toxin-antitoxin system HicA family toxin [Methanospirillum sp.]|uniref:type II toxin-antitoxin system HicA family toxin n=1 Tax=Methanospirillum sp. TaxID=45200 RepID=UPI0035A18EE0